MSKEELEIGKQNHTSQTGITLVALIITIIVMLILVGVSVIVALNGGLFTTAKNAADRTQEEKEKELTLEDGTIEVDGKKYASYEDYLNDKEIIELPEGWTKTTTPEEWTKSDGTINDKVTAITDKNNNTVPLPEGYRVSLEEGESTISEGLVITDGENEFVWIPVSKEKVFEKTYTFENYSEPTIISHDTQTNLNKYYGDDYYTISNTGEYQNNASNKFAYKAHYAEMVASVNKYKGFYIGRYETTINEGEIGSKEGATILSADKSIAQTNNKQVRWWGLYDVQRNSDVKGNGSIIQTNMIWGRQWEAMLTYFTSEGKTYTNTEVTTLSTAGKQNAGQAEYKYIPTDGEEKIISDEICNIYDLRGNVRDWTAEAYSTYNRVYRGRSQQRLQKFSRLSQQLLSDWQPRRLWITSHTLYKIRML